MPFYLSAVSRILGDAEPDSLRTEETARDALRAAVGLVARFPPPDHAVRIFTPASRSQDMRQVLLDQLAKMGVTAEVI